VKLSWRSSILPGAAAVLLAVPVCHAGWDFTAPADPSRNWSASIAGYAEYDDNFNSTENNRQSGYRLGSDLTLRVKAIGERSLVSGQYDYTTAYPNYFHMGGLAENHMLSASVNYSVTPRLLLSLNESFTESTEPSVVQTVNKVPVTLAAAGSYLYDAVSGSAVYSLTRRWNLSFAGGWDIWRYEETAYATNSDHQDYSMTLSALYSLNPVTVIGVNYQYAATAYTNPGPDGSLNGYSNTGYLSLTRQFDPKLSVAVNGGYTLHESGNGSTSTSPSAYGAVAYNYAQMSSISLIVAEYLSTASVGITRSFSTQQGTSFSLQANHQFTPRFHTMFNGSYVYSTFKSPVVGANEVLTLSPTDQSIQLHWNIGYDFRPWASVGFDYTYTRLLSSNTLLIQPYSRDVAGIRLTFNY